MRETKKISEPCDSSKRMTTATYANSMCATATRQDQSDENMRVRSMLASVEQSERTAETTRSLPARRRLYKTCLHPVKVPHGFAIIGPFFVIAACLAAQLTQQQLFFNSPTRPPSANHQQRQSHPRHVSFHATENLVPNQSSSSGAGASTSSTITTTALSPWRSQQMSPFSAAANQHTSDQSAQSEARGGALSRNLYSRGARNASLSGGVTGGSWHFPRISPEQAAEVLLTGAQVINRIAQADTPLNYCKTPDNQEGECSDIRKCIWLVLDKARLKQSVCLRNLIIPAVCCPVSSANNTPIANMIQSTLEPVLFRPKGPKGKKPAAPSVSQPQQQQVTSTRPTDGPTPQSSTPTSSPLIIRNYTTPSVGSTSSSTTTSTTATALQAAEKPINQLFQDIQDSPQLDNSHLYQHGTKNVQYNRTVSLRYPWANETCGESGRTRTGRIVGGTDSKLGQWPWMTAMYLNKRSAFTSGAGEFWCGGALINRRFILTAAHCLSDQRGNKYKNDQVTIKLGGVDLVRHQAPADILRNAELGELRELRAPGEPQQSFATHQHQRRPAAGSRQRTSGAQRSGGDDDEEFSWTAFITKALGLSGSSSASSSSPSISSSSSVGAGTSPTSSISPDGSLKAIDSPAAASNSRKQQLAAHAQKTYFKEYKVASIKQHPKFQRHGFYNDIGLIELKSDVDYDELVSPICLPTEYDLKRDLTGYMATVLGWGTLSYGGQGSKLLQQVAMPVWSNKDCDERYLQHIGKTFLCAGFLSGGKDACQGDSGGPLMVGDQSGRWTLHGVVSFGKTCAQAGYPGVYTRVTEYLDWIRDNTDLSTYMQSASVGAATTKM